MFVREGEKERNNFLYCLLQIEAECKNCQKLLKIGIITHLLPQIAVLKLSDTDTVFLDLADFGKIIFSIMLMKHQIRQKFEKI